MKKLVCLFLVGLSLVGCRDNRFYLDKASALWGRNYDSLCHYLQKVDSASLTSEEQARYQFLRLGTQMVYGVSRLKDWSRADSLADEMKTYLRSRRDSVAWYHYKFYIKRQREEADSAFRYLEEGASARLLDEYFVYVQKGTIFEEREELDSALTAYQCALEADSTKDVFFLSNRILDLLLKLEDYPKVWKHLERLRARMNRSDVPYYNLMKGDMWTELHQPDSAMRYYRIATETGNGFVASQAYERMGKTLFERSSEREAFDMCQKSIRVWNDIYMRVDSRRSEADFTALKLKNQLNELKVERQHHVILILTLILSVVVLTGGFIFYFFHRRRVMERERLVQENRLLRQQEELSMLREKDARMREELFKRMNVFKKLSDTEA